MMRWALVGVVAVIAAAAVIAGALTGRPDGNVGRKTEPPSTTLAHSGAPAFVVRLATREAAGNCDLHPDGASYVRTTRQAAEEVSGAEVDSDQPVYLVLLRGTFVDYDAHGIYRARDAFPRGTEITFTVDAATHDTLDFGIGRRAPDLAQLGTVHDFTADLLSAPAGPTPPLCNG
jgi:hypothetical protein